MNNIRLARHGTQLPSNYLAGFLPAIQTPVIMLLLPLSVQALISQQERYALVSLFENLGGVNWTNSTGWLGSAGTECGWYGVTCDPTNASVTGLNLSQNDGAPVAIGH